MWPGPRFPPSPELQLNSVQPSNIVGAFLDRRGGSTPLEVSSTLLGKALVHLHPSLSYACKGGGSQRQKAQGQQLTQKYWIESVIVLCSCREAQFGDKFGESLRGSQAPPSFWKVPRLPRKFPELPRKFFGDFPGSSLTVELNSIPEVPRINFTKALKWETDFIQCRCWGLCSPYKVARPQPSTG